MKKGLLTSALCLVGVSAFAGVNLNINTPVQTGVIPNTGSITLTYTGTVTVLPAWDVNGASLWFAGLTGTGPFLTAVFDPGFVAYIGAVSPGVGYSGNLFDVTITSTTAAGFYDQNAGGTGGFSEMWVSAARPGGSSFSDNEYYAVNVVVPEPATMAVLGLGAAALMRRRNRK